MNNKRDYKGSLRTIFWSPRAFLLLIFGLGSVVWAIDKYWTQRQITWNETKAKLTDIQTNERLRNKEKEYFLRLTFEYKVSDKLYQAYSEKMLTAESAAETEIKELKETKGETIIYYNVENPTDTTFDLQQTKADNNLLYVLIPSMIMIGGLAYWGLKIRYEHYFKTGS